MSWIKSPDVGAMIQSSIFFIIIKICCEIVLSGGHVLNSSSTILPSSGEILHLLSGMLW